MVCIHPIHDQRQTISVSLRGLPVSLRSFKLKRLELDQRLF